MEVSDSFTSPLWMITQEPELTGLLQYLIHKRHEWELQPRGIELVFSKARLAKVKSAFSRVICLGEERLHRLAELLCRSLLNSYVIESVVLGEVESSRERFTLVQQVSPDVLHRTTDIDLGNQQLQKLRFYDGKEWGRAFLVANVVEYQPTEPNVYGISRIVSRIKAEEEIWNKVVDEIFGLDQIVQRDKKLQHLSKFIKDVFGLKVVVGSSSEVRALQQALEDMQFDEALREQCEVPCIETTERLQVLEVKDYLGTSERKQSGWEALKSVVQWWERTFEIQIQPLTTFYREREHFTKESHAGFKSRRESVRDQVAEQIPLMRFYRDLLRYLFAPEQAQRSLPVLEGIVVRVDD